MEIKVPIEKKYMLSIREAAQYFNIGIKQMRRIAEDHKRDFALVQGNRYLIIREKMEEYIMACVTGEEELKL